MTPRIETSRERKVVGIRRRMSIAQLAIGELWSGFMPIRKDITNAITSDLISAAVYTPTHFTDFALTNEFERWAGVEVSDFDNTPSGLEHLVIPSGLYAVFNYKGLSTDSSIFQYIFQTWIPSSHFVVDNRPHYELLGEKYRNNDPESEEEIWIPIKEKEEERVVDLTS